MVFHTTLITFSSRNLNQVHIAALHQNRPWFRQLNPRLRVMFSVFKEWKFYEAWTGTQWHAKTNLVFLCLRFLAGAGQKIKMTITCHSTDIGLHFGVTFENLKKMADGCSWREATGSWYILRYSGNRQRGQREDWNCKNHRSRHLLSSFPFTHYPAGISLWFCTAIFWLISTPPERGKPWQIPCLSTPVFLWTTYREAALWWTFQFTFEDFCIEIVNFP